MASPVNILDDKSIRYIERMLYAVNRAYKNRTLVGDESIDHEEMTTPEVYIARTPVGGIDGIFPEDIGTGAEPSYADCTVYRLSLASGLMESMTFTKRIYNVSPNDIAGEKWVIVLRDKYGLWYAIDAMPGSDGGFPAEITETFNADTGYAWQQMKLLDDGTYIPHENGNVGVHAYTPDEDEDLRVGTRGWLFPNPDNLGTGTGTSTSIGTGTSDDYYIFIPVYKRRVTCGTGSSLVSQVSLDGGETWIDDEQLGVDCDSGTSDYNDDVIIGGCGWVAGLRPENCLRLTVVAASGRCADINMQQRLDLAWNGSCWESGQTTPGTFSTGTADDDFVYIDGQGPAIFCIVNGVPTLTIDGYYLVLNRCGSVGGVNFIEFSGGNQLCEPAGTPPDPVDCENNTFVVRLTCIACPMRWYCVATDDEGCDGTGSVGDRDVLEMTVFEAAELGDLICAGPFETELEAIAECYGDAISECCDGNLPRRLYLHTTECPECSNTVFDLIFNEDGDNGPRYYSPEYNCSGHVIRFEFFCEVNVGTIVGTWYIHIYVDEVMSIGGNDGTDNLQCGFADGIAVAIPNAGAACEINFNGVVYDTP